MVSVNFRLFGPPVPGEIMPDATVYAGISPDTRRPLFVMPEDHSRSMEFKKAQEEAAGFVTREGKGPFGHKDWRLPTQAELSLLFNHRAAIGGFDVSPVDHPKIYQSSLLNTVLDAALCQDFGNGCSSNHYTCAKARVRYVR